MSYNTTNINLDTIENAIDGDINSFEIIVTTYERLVYSVAYNMVQNTEDAADISQETFVKLYKNIRTFEGPEHIKSWLCRVATNLSIDLLRKQKVRKNTSLEALTEPDDEKQGMQFPSDSKTPEEEVLATNEAETLKKCIEKLPDEYKSIIVLRDINGLSYQEISETLEINLGTVKSRISRGRNALKKLFLMEQSPLSIVKDNKN